MSQSHSKRPRTKKNQDIGTSSQSSPPPTNALPSRGGTSGKAGKCNILDGIYFNENEIVGTNFWNLVLVQGWDRFLTSHEPIYSEWVYFFFEHVDITFGRGGLYVNFCIKVGNRTFKYTSKDFLDDFGLESVGFSTYVGNDWPEGLPSLVSIAMELNGDRTFPPEMKRDMTVPWMPLLTGDDRFLANALSRSIIPRGTQDRRINRIMTCLIHLVKSHQQINLPKIIGAHMRYAMNNSKATTLPYGMLITHIMRKWGINRMIPHGPELEKSTLAIGVRSFKSQGLTLFRGRFWSSWEIEEASPLDREELDALMGRRPRAGHHMDHGDDDDDDDVGGDGVQEEAPGHLSTRGEIRRLSERVDRLTERQDRVERRQKKQSKFLRGLAKFMSCIGEKLGCRIV